MATTVSRWLPKHLVAAPTSGAASGPSLADALADRDIACIRIRARYDARFRMYHDLAAWTEQFRRVHHLDPAGHDADQTRRAELIAWYLELYPTVNWSLDHQIDLRTGEITAAPDAWEPGFIPEDDLTFNGAPAVYSPHTATTTERAA